jgi:serine phosphatase RsbU (regulator of sigma subunit)
MPSSLAGQDENHFPHDWPCPPQFKVGFLSNNPLVCDIVPKMNSLLQRYRRNTVSAIESVAAPFPAVGGAEIAAVFSGQRRGGDFYDAVRVSPSRVLFGMVDLHARLRQNRKMPSALRRVFCDTGTQLLKSAEANEPDALIELYVQLNRFVIERGGGAHSCPAFGGCYNEDLGTVCYFNAGHTPGLVRHSSNVSELAATCLPLGLFSHSAPDARMIALEPGAVFLLVSRSVIAAEANGEEYGLQRVGETLKNAHLVGARDLCTVVLEGMQGFARKPQCEVITALALIRQHPGG